MKLYMKYVLMQLKSQLEYKTSFLLTALGQFIASFTSFISIYFLFEHFYQVDGFSLADVLLCYGVILLSFALAECFFRGFDTFDIVLSNGEFDRMLVRPRNILFQVVVSRIDFSRIGRFLQALLVLIYAVNHCGVVWSSDKVAVLLVMMIAGFVLFSSLFIVYASFCFFTIEGLEFINIFTDGGREFGQYPLSIYGKDILKFFTYCIPLACVQYYPLLYILDDSVPRFYGIVPAYACLFFIPCYLFWRYGLSKYKSTGS